MTGRIYFHSQIVQEGRFKTPIGTDIATSSNHGMCLQLNFSLKTFQYCSAKPFLFPSSNSFSFFASIIHPIQWPLTQMSSSSSLPFKCNFNRSCNHRTGTVEEMGVHVRSFHLRPFFCGIDKCFKGFNSHNALLSH